jgi:phage gp29-like protein
LATASQRIASVFSGAASLFQSAARLINGPRAPGPAPGAPEAYGGATGVPRAVALPGMTPWGSTRGPLNDATAKAMLSPEAYFGQLSYSAGPTLTRFSSFPATDLTPAKISGAQQEALAGWPLRWEEMIEQVLSRDAHLSGIAQQRVDDVVKGSWRLARATPDDVGACLRGFCEEALRTVDTLEDAFGWLLWGNAYCYSSNEVVWRRDRLTFPGPRGETIGPIDVVVPARFAPVHAKHFRFDLATDEPLLWLGSSQVSLPFGKFIFYRGEGEHPIVERRGYMWPCVWLSMFKSIGWAGWATFVERFGLPVPLTQYDEYKAAYTDILNNLGSGKGAVLPQNGATFDFKDSPAGGRSSDPHSALSDACDSAQSIRILGATLTARISNAGSFAASTTHAEVKYAREERDARRLWATLRRDLLAPMVAFNAIALCEAIRAAGYQVSPEDLPRRVPRGMHRVPREVDPQARASIVSTALNEWGMPVGKEALYDEFNLPMPMSDDDAAPGKPVPVTSGGRMVGAVQAATDGADAPKDAESRAALAGEQPKQIAAVADAPAEEP